MSIATPPNRTGSIMLLNTTQRGLAAQSLERTRSATDPPHLRATILPYSEIRSATSEHRALTKASYQPIALSLARIANADARPPDQAVYFGEALVCDHRLIQKGCLAQSLPQTDQSRPSSNSSPIGSRPRASRVSVACNAVSYTIAASANRSISSATRPQISRISWTNASSAGKPILASSQRGNNR